MLSNVRMDADTVSRMATAIPDTLSVKDAAKFMGKTEQFVRIGLQRNILPFGWAVLMGKEWSYFISRKKFEEYTGISVESSTNGGEVK